MGNFAYGQLAPGSLPSALSPVRRARRKENEMPRYMVERTFPEGLKIPINDDGIKGVQSVIDTNSTAGVTWVHSYVSTDKRKTYCVYDSPSPEAIQAVAAGNGLPIDSISEVRVLDPYFYS
jgi:hypothetical protein